MLINLLRYRDTIIEDLGDIRMKRLFIFAYFALPHCLLASDEALEEVGEAYLDQNGQGSEQDIDIDDDTIELDSEGSEEGKKEQEKKIEKDSKSNANKKQDKKSAQNETKKESTKDSKKEPPKKVIKNSDFSIFIPTLREVIAELEQHIKTQTDSRNRSIFRKLHAEYLSLLDYIEDAAKPGVDRVMNTAYINIALDDIYFATAKNNVAGISAENISKINAILFKTQKDKIVLERIRKRASWPVE